MSCQFCFNLRPIQLCFGVLAKLLKAIISFVTSVCPSFRRSVRMKELGSHWTDCHEIWYIMIINTLWLKIQVLLKSDKNNERLTWRAICIYGISLNFSQGEKCFGHNSWRKSKYILCSVTFFFRKSYRLWQCGIIR